MSSRKTAYPSSMEAVNPRKHSGDRSVTVTSLKSRLAPTIHTAMSAAVDTVLGEVVLVLNESHQELFHKQQENERLKVRLEVSERELKTLQDCLCSAQKLIDQLQVSYSGQHSFMASMGSGLDRDHNPRSVNGADPLTLSGSVDQSLHGFEQREEFKMCQQLSIQEDGSVTNHNMDSFSSNTHSMCSDSNPTDENEAQGSGVPSGFEIKQEQVPVSGPRGRKDPGPDGDHPSHSVGDLSYAQVTGERHFSPALRHQRPFVGVDGQKALARTGATTVPGGRAEAGPSVPDPAVEPSADRPHHCLECGKTFRLISSLKKHIRIHTGEKPYPCGVCGRRFRESGALKTHLRIHTGEKPYSCSECGNCFRHLDGLRKHRRTHTGEKPYVCAICGKRLSRLQHLKHHQLIHTGERPCCCPFCNRTFKEPAALRKHVRTHREEGGHMGGVTANEETEADATDDMSTLHPAAPSPQMRFGEWGADEEGGPAVDCV
ncbi:zinc finger and SCAN domain-containing protein 31 [Gouania willdenowi]|uniref:zinc finger and SCAN domain-containing protein 31 n=1 Tax=Gouania willdenowi TaxID=441366 RepID=UPI001055DF88|nr:zinc finger and SCAN domain-containing protein 31-like [Gouania willdenowi]